MPNALTTIVSELELGCPFISVFPVLFGVFIGVFPGDLLNVILGVFAGDLLNIILGCRSVLSCNCCVLSVSSTLVPVAGVGVPCMVPQSSSHIDSLRGSMSYSLAPVQSIAEH